MPARRASPTLALFINSALAFASAQLITAALHEAGHGIVAQLLGFSPHIYAFYEDNPNGSAWQTLLILAAGPIASLVIGGLFWRWYRAMRPRYTFARLLLLWLALLGVLTFVNYLIVTPWLAAGDTAQFADILHWSMLVRYGMTVIGIGVIVLLARPAARAIFALAPRVFTLDSPRARRRFILKGFYLPLIAGIALTALAGIGSRPINVFYELLATLGSIDLIVATLYADVTPPSAVAALPDAPLRIEPAAVLIYLALVLLYILAFAHGVPI